MENTWEWSGAQLRQSQQAEQESKAQQWDTGTKSETSRAEIAEGALAAVAIHGRHTEVDIDAFTGAGRGASLIQGVAKVDVPCMESEIEGADIYVAGGGESPVGPWPIASYSPKPAAADNVTQ